MNYKTLRETIRTKTASDSVVVQILNRIGISVTRDGFFKVRPEDRTPSCKINKDGSCHDYGSGEHYSDVVSLLFDGYRAFDSISSTMEWTCEELNINMEAYHE